MHFEKYFVILEDTKAAKASLKWLIKMNGVDFDLSNVDLQDIVSDEAEEPGLWETLKDFAKYKYYTFLCVFSSSSV